MRDYSCPASPERGIPMGGGGATFKGVANPGAFTGAADPSTFTGDADTRLVVPTEKVGVT